MRFAIDVSNLQPGSIVEQSQCEQILKVKANQVQYAFQLMQLCDYVQRLLWKDNKPWTVVSQDGKLVVLTHEQASKYNASRFNGGLKKIRRAYDRLVAVDCGSFNDELKESHTKAIVRTSRILQAIKSTRANIVVKPVVSLIPKRA